MRLKQGARYGCAAAVGQLVTLVLLSVLLMTACMPVSFASGALDIDHLCDLTLAVDADVTGMNVTLYKIAEMNSAMQYIAKDDIQLPAGVDLNKVRGFDEWSALAKNLCGKITDENGLTTQTVSGKAYYTKLSCGLYLVVIEDFSNGGYIYNSPAFLIALPSMAESGSEQGGNEVTYDVYAEIKYVKTPERRKMLVRSRWIGESNEDKRPEFVTVDVKRDGEIYQTLILSNENNWEYELDDIEANHEWKIEERPVPDGFKTRYSRVFKQGVEMLIVENYTEDEEPQSTPAPTIVPSVTTEPEINNTPTPKPNTPGGRIPQTGMIMWPVYALYGLSVMLLISGILLIVKNRREEHE